MPKKTLNPNLGDRIVRSGKEFNDAMEELIEAASIDIGKGVRGTGQDLYKSLVYACPKDTARAASGFNINKEVSDWVPPEEDFKNNKNIEIKTNQATARNLGQLAGIPISEAFSISNNIDYLPALENGHSRQASGGFIALALQQTSAKLKALVAKYNRKRYA